MEFREQPGIDVSPLVVPHVDDEPLEIEDGIELPRPLLDIAGAHGAQVNVTDVPLRVLLHFKPALLGGMPH